MCHYYDVKICSIENQRFPFSGFVLLTVCFSSHVINIQMRITSRFAWRHKDCYRHVHSTVRTWNFDHGVGPICLTKFRQCSPLCTTYKLIVATCWADGTFISSVTVYNILIRWTYAKPIIARRACLTSVSFLHAPCASGYVEHIGIVISLFGQRSPVLNLCHSCIVQRPTPCTTHTYAELPWRQHVHIYIQLEGP